MGRFINSDGLVSTGTGVLGYNMFAYCDNNPVLLQDSTGSRPIIGGGLRDETPEQRKLSFSYINSQVKSPYNVGNGPYASADQAAMAFASSTYSKTSCTRHEYGAAIYSETVNGVTEYNYTTPVAGEPHSIKVGKIEAPAGATKVATVHTHPNANKFSGADILNAQKRGVDNYVVGPGLKLRKYTVSTGIVSVVGTVYPIALTSWQRESLVAEFQISWDSHLATCNFNNCSPGDFPG